jgi:hypothetical protein
LTWFGYAVDRVPELARGIGGIQRPVLSSPREGASFPVGRLEPEDRAKVPLPRARPLVLRSQFHKEESFFDDLGLAGRVDALLRQASEKRDGEAPITLDATECEGAYRLAGRYRIQGDAVVVDVSAGRDGERVEKVTVTGTRGDLDALAHAIVREVNQRLKP